MALLCCGRGRQEQHGTSNEEGDEERTAQAGNQAFSFDIHSPDSVAVNIAAITASRGRTAYRLSAFSTFCDGRPFAVKPF